MNTAFEVLFAGLLVAVLGCTSTVENPDTRLMQIDETLAYIEENGGVCSDVEPICDEAAQICAIQQNGRCDALLRKCDRETEKRCVDYDAGIQTPDAAIAEDASVATADASSTPDAAIDPDPADVPEGANVGYSLQPDRTSLLELDGASVSGEIYIVLDVEGQGAISNVDFYLDGNYQRSEVQYPFDFAGATSAGAEPWDATSVGSGQHTVRIDVTDGSGTWSASASFSVGNDPEPDPEPNPDPASYSDAPRSAAEALGRSAYWAPSLQKDFFPPNSSGQYILRTSYDGQIIENMIIHGEVEVLHDNVQIRNVTILCNEDKHGGNVGLEVTKSGVKGLVVDGVNINPGRYFWSSDENKPFVPTAAFRANDDAYATVRNFAVGMVGDGMKINAGGKWVFEDGFINLFRGVGAGGSLYNKEWDHCDGLQVERGAANVTWRRVWSDVDPWTVDRNGQTPYQLQGSGSTNLQASADTKGDGSVRDSSYADVTLRYEQCQFRGGNYVLRLFDTVYLSGVGNHAEGYSQGTDTNNARVGEGTVVIGEWRGNTKAGGATWLAPPN